MSLKEKKLQKFTEVFKNDNKQFHLESYYFALYTANINKFLPSILRENYKKLFRETIYYQHCSQLEQDSRNYLIKSNIINNSNLDFAQPNKIINTIFATFHLGSYRTIISYLFEAGLKIVLIIDDSVYNSQLSSFFNTTNTILKKKNTSELIVLNVKDKTSIIKLKTLVKSGYVLAVYLDGNSGIKNVPQDFTKSFIPVQFFDQQIYVKNGIGKLASMLNLDIVPILSYRTSSKVFNNTIEIFPKISLNDFDNKNEFSIQSIIKCYRYLEQKLFLFPSQWECWGYIHQWFLRNESQTYESINYEPTRFNSERYTIFNVEKSQFILDIYSYQTYPINNITLQIIMSQNFEHLKKSLLSELINKNIII